MPAKKVGQYVEGILVRGIQDKVIQRLDKGSRIYLKPTHIITNLPGVPKIQSPTESYVFIQVFILINLFGILQNV